MSICGSVHHQSKEKVVKISLSWLFLWRILLFLW